MHEFTFLIAQHLKARSARKGKERRKSRKGEKEGEAEKREYNNNITFKDFKNSPKANFPFQTLSRMPCHTFNYS